MYYNFGNIYEMIEEEKELFTIIMVIGLGVLILIMNHLEII